MSDTVDLPALMVEAIDELVTRFARIYPVSEQPEPTEDVIQNNRTS